MDVNNRYRKVDLLLKGKIYLQGRVEEACIGIEAGKIVMVCKEPNAPYAEKVFSYTGKKLILPGMVDMHVHMRDLGQEHKEDWYTGSMAALKGGVTTVVDMPNNIPFINTRESLLLKVEKAKEKSIVDYGFYLGFPASLNELSKSRDMIFGVKLYPNDLSNSENLVNLLQKCAELDLLLIVHPEDPTLLEECKKWASKIGVKLDPSLHPMLRAPVVEYFAVKNLLEIARRVHGARIHFTHVSTGESVKTILHSKLEGRKVSFDVTPHHAFLNSRLYAGRQANIAKVNPPLRPEEDRRIIYNALVNRQVDAYVTDHAPHRFEEKMAEKYEDIPPGFPGLEIALPLLLTEVFEGRADIRVIESYSLKPAEILGIAKGQLAVGFDGDITIVEYGVEETVKGEDFFSKAKYTPFEGYRLRARVVDVYLRGLKVLEEGNVIGRRGVGCFARRIER
ncbi:MAG: dihydroorotase family protein [Thermoproteales archaeon]|nr:dihydroorotase family protein [Thermoproteales archaeon]